MCGHDSSHVISLHQELVLVPAALFVNVNDSSGDLRNTLHHHLWNDNRATSEGGEPGQVKRLPRPAGAVRRKAGRVFADPVRSKRKVQKKMEEEGEE